MNQKSVSRRHGTHRSLVENWRRCYQLHKPKSGLPVLSRLLHHTLVISCTRFLVLQSVRDLMTPPFVSPFHCVSGPLCVHRTRASAAPKSTASVFTALPVANPPVVICDTTPSMTLLNGPWRQRTSLPCWSQNRYQEMMENVLTASLCCHGQTVVA